MSLSHSFFINEMESNHYGLLSHKHSHMRERMRWFIYCHREILRGSIFRQSSEFPVLVVGMKIALELCWSHATALYSHCWKGKDQVVWPLDQRPIDTVGWPWNKMLCDVLEPSPYLVKPSKKRCWVCIMYLSLRANKWCKISLNWSCTQPLIVLFHNDCTLHAGNR